MVAIASPIEQPCEHYGLMAECAAERVLGPDVDIEIEAYDECNTVIDTSAVVRKIAKAGAGFIGLVGVSLTNFPARLISPARFSSRPSGCDRRLPCERLSFDAAQISRRSENRARHGRHTFRRRGRGPYWRAASRHQCWPSESIYNYLNDLPEMAAATLPILPRSAVTRIAGHYSSFDAGRGCPFQCSFCTIINVQGRKSRYRTPDDVEAIVRTNAEQGITRFFVTDDNFARNKNWEAILDRLIELRERHGFNIRLLLQVDTLCHRIPSFIEKAARAGCTAVFIGLENINPEIADGDQEASEQDLGIPRDASGLEKGQGYDLCGLHPWLSDRHARSIARDIEIIKEELPIDILEFFFLTPLPGSEDHKKLLLREVPMDPDMNKYDLEHACTAHALMSQEVWERGFMPTLGDFIIPTNT